LFRFPKLLKDVAGIIKIVEQIEADGFERKLNGPPQHGKLNKKVLWDKGCKKFDFGHWLEDLDGGGCSNKVDHQIGKSSNVGKKEMKESITVATSGAKLGISLWSASIRRNNALHHESKAS
jgi:hypothetical protein